MSGPLVNIIIAIISLFIPNSQDVFYSNLILTILNLLPIYPLDGGRIIKSILHIKLGYYESYKLLNTLSNIMMVFLTIITSILIFYFENIAMLFIILYLIWITIQENKKFNLVKKTYSLINN